MPNGALETSRFRSFVFSVVVPVAILVVLFLAYGWQARSVLHDRGAFDHDEVITHLTVSGHADDWDPIALGGPPAGTWVPSQPSTGR